MEKDAFNFLLSRQRQVIERAFGLLVGRFGVFWRPLRMKMSHIPLVIRVCCKLHNICIDRFTSSSNVETYHNTSHDTDHQPGDNSQPIWTDQTGMYRGFRSDIRGAKRERITLDIPRKGFSRPVNNSWSRVVANQLAGR